MRTEVTNGGRADEPAQNNHKRAGELNEAAAEKARLEAERLIQESKDELDPEKRKALEQKALEQVQEFLSQKNAAAQNFNNAGVAPTTTKRDGSNGSPFTSNSAAQTALTDTYAAPTGAGSGLAGPQPGNLAGRMGPPPEPMGAGPATGANSEIAELNPSSATRRFPTNTEATPNAAGDILAGELTEAQAKAELANWGEYSEKAADYERIAGILERRADPHTELANSYRASADRLRERADAAWKRGTAPTAEKIDAQNGLSLLERNLTNDEVTNLSKLSASKVLTGLQTGQLTEGNISMGNIVQTNGGAQWTIDGQTFDRTEILRPGSQILTGANGVELAFRYSNGGYLVTPVTPEIGALRRVPQQAAPAAPARSIPSAGGNTQPPVRGGGHWHGNTWHADH